MAPAPDARSAPSQISVSRIAGWSERCISAFIRWRGTSEWYHSAEARPVSIAQRVLSPVRL